MDNLNKFTDKHINELPIISELTGNELFPIWGSNMSNQTSIDKVKAYISQSLFSGASSQFLKADGSVDDTKYLSLAGGKISNNTNALPLKINSSQDTVAIQFCKDDEEKGNVGYNNVYGSVLFNYASNKVLGIKDDGTPHFDGKKLAYLDETNAIPLKINSSQDTVAIQFSQDNNAKSTVGWNSEQGSVLFNYASNKVIGIKDDGTPHYQGNKLWHEGNDGTGSGLDADLLDGLDSAAYLPKVAYNYKQGCLVKLKALANSNTMVTLLIEGNSYSANRLPVKTIVQFYNYNAGNTIGSCNAVNYGYNVGDIKVFNYDNYVYAWIAQIYASMTYAVTAIGSVDGDKLGNMVDSITNAAMPTDGVTRLVTITPKQAAFTDSNVASADKLTTKQLTNEDLNDIREGYKVYYGHFENTCTNKPANVSSFSLQVLFGGSSYIAQLLIDTIYKNVYKRIYNAITLTWSSWQQLATTDGSVAKLSMQQLTNENLNDIKVTNVKYYFIESGNTCSNKPNNFTWGFLQVLGSVTSSEYCVQIVTNLNGESWKRKYNGTEWTSWKKTLDESDITLATTQDIKNIIANN